MLHPGTSRTGGHIKACSKSGRQTVSIRASRLDSGHVHVAGLTNLNAAFELRIDMQPVLGSNLPLVPKM